MIKAEQIPYEVKMKLRAVLLGGETDEAVALAAAIAAWPGAFTGDVGYGCKLILPLPKDKE
jgi:hypothetical protein